MENTAPDLDYEDFPVPASRWRYLVDPPRTGPWNMALDEVLLESLSASACPATVRFYSWHPACLSLGYFQKEGEINFDECRRRGIQIVRRLTGGRAILHARELTYSIVMRTSAGVLESFRRINMALLRGLGRMGVEAALVSKAKKPAEAGKSSICFLSPSWGEIMSGGKKLLGSAQTRRGSSILQHGSLPLELDRRELVSLFLEGESLQELTETSMTCLSELLPVMPETGEIIEAFVCGFEEEYGISLVKEDWRQKDLERAGQLVREKYEGEGNFAG